MLRATRKRKSPLAAQGRGGKTVATGTQTANTGDLTEPSGMQQPPSGLQRPEQVNDRQGPQAPEHAVPLGPPSGPSGNIYVSSLGLNFPQISPLPSVHAGLGTHVTQSAKDKICQGQYIELATLLEAPGQGARSGSRLSVDHSGQLALSQTVEKRINSIEEWTEAFIIYTSIYLSVHPHKTQDLLKYMANIRLAARNHLGLGWRNYDAQFRLRMAQDPASKSYADIDYELWLFCMGPSAFGSLHHDKKCYEYNYRSCYRMQCPFRHCCLNCSGNHRAQQCRRAAPPAFTQRPARPAAQRFPPPHEPRPRNFTPRHRFPIQY